MIERPILFSAPMVRAILAGTKTQTRRAIKPSPVFALPFIGADDKPTGKFGLCMEYQRVIDKHVRCPYGQPGDRLWVRESWMPDPPIDDSWASTQWAGCRDGKIAGVPERFRHPRFCNYAADWLHGPVLWTPSIHMPRWASRITLEITGVRVERLCEISESDAMAEGVDMNEMIDMRYSPSMPHVTVTMKPRTAREAYAALWESINGPGSWDANPWVWVVDFRAAPKEAP